MSQAGPSRYTVGTAVFGPNFYGREAQLRAVRNRPWAWICGQRRMGKTSLLHRVEAEIEAQGGIPLVLSLVFIGAKGDGKTLFAKLLEANQERLDKRPGLSRVIRAKEFARMGTAERFRKLVDVLRGEGHEVAFLWDEAERLIGVEQNDPGFLGQLLDYMQDVHGFRFILTATQLLAKLYRLANGSDQFLYQFRWVPLPGLDDQQAIQLLQCAQHDAWEPPLPLDVAIEVSRWAGCHPFILQILGTMLGECKKSVYDGSAVSLDDARSCQRALSKSPLIDLRGMFLDDYRKLTGFQQEVLRAACNERGDSGIDASTLRQAGGFSPEEASAIGFLENYGYIAIDEGGSIRLRFKFYRDFLPEESVGSDAPAEVVGRIKASNLTQPTQWFIRQPQSKLEFHHMIVAGTKGIGGVSEEKVARPDVFEDVLERLRRRPANLAVLEQAGDRFGEEVLSNGIIEVLHHLEGHPLVIYHDSVASRVPWEIVRIRGRTLCEGAGLSRRHLSTPTSVAKWLDERPQSKELAVLLIANPTCDLDEADLEANQIRRIFDPVSSVTITPILRQEAKKARLMAEFASGRYDVAHYAGHAYFDPNSPGSSGLICQDDEILSGADLVSVSAPPALVVFNACQAGRIRMPRDLGIDATREADTSIRSRVGVAEILLESGISNFVGTYWPVGDEDAAMFALTFYQSLSQGNSIGAAMASARHVLRSAGSVDWANYIHYGDYDFVLKPFSSPPDLG
jgi:CHAT domain